MKRLIYLFVMVMLVSGCATTPAPYVKSRGKGFGYSDFRISEDTFTVSFSGAVAASPDLIQKMALVRASELTLENEFTHFIVLENIPSQRIVMIPTTIGFGSLGASLPSITLKIKCFKDNYPEDSINAKEFLKYNHPKQK